MSIIPKQPFSFDLTCNIFSKGDPQIEVYENGEYRKVIRTSQGLFLLKVREEKGELVINSDDPEVLEKVRYIFDTKRDLQEFYSAVTEDKVLTNLTSQLNGLRTPATASVFEALIYAIVEQQIALKVAVIMEKRIIRKFGEEFEGHYAIPTPERLATASILELRECGLSTRKAEYIKGISQAVIDGLDLEALKDKPDEEVIETLIKLRGVGLWTAEYCMVRGMRKLDAIPADDLGLRSAIGKFYFGRRASAEECRKIAENWKGWRGYASWYLLKEYALSIGYVKELNQKRLERL